MLGRGRHGCRARGGRAQRRSWAGAGGAPAAAWAAGAAWRRGDRGLRQVGGRGCAGTPLPSTIWRVFLFNRGLMPGPRRGIRASGFFPLPAGIGARPEIPRRRAGRGRRLALIARRRGRLGPARPIAVRSRSPSSPRPTRRRCRGSTSAAWRLVLHRRRRGARAVDGCHNRHADAGRGPIGMGAGVPVWRPLTRRRLAATAAPAAATAAGAAGRRRTGGRRRCLLGLGAPRAASISARARARGPPSRAGA